MASNKTHLQQTTVIGVRLLLVVLLLSVSTAHVNAQPYTTIVSYPRPGTAVPVPGVLNVADAPPVPVTVVPASSTSPSSTTAAATTEQTTTTASCTTNWCTRDGQWLPINVSAHFSHPAMSSSPVQHGIPHSQHAFKPLTACFPLRLVCVLVVR